MLTVFFPKYYCEDKKKINVCETEVKTVDDNINVKGYCVSEPSTLFLAPRSLQGWLLLII